MTVRIRKIINFARVKDTTRKNGMIKKKRDTVKMIILLFAITLTGCGKQTEQPKDPYYILVEKNIKTNFTGSFRRNFNDMNDDHISVAVAKGIAPVDSVAALRQLADSARLEKVETCEYYKIDSLTHSHPYLVPSAKKLLDTIGRSFNDTLRSRGGGNYRIIVTSLLRMQDDIKRLRRYNVNAMENSAHSYGTTFDITYRRFDRTDGQFVIPDRQLRLMLSEILKTLRARGECYVKYEIKQGCYHITVRN